MPYSISEVKDWPDHVRRRHRTDPEKGRQWVHIWNGVYEDTGSEERAFKAANAKVFGKMAELTVRDGTIIIKRLKYDGQ